MTPVRQRGFTLIELIVAMTVATVVMGFMALLLATPVEAYFAQSRRADLTDSAEAVVRNFASDVRKAVPNSIRISADHRVIELLLAEDVLRYLPDDVESDPARALNNAAADSEFVAVMGRLTQPVTSSSHRLVINHLNLAGTNAYDGVNVITPPNTTLTITPNAATGEDHITVDPAFQFMTDSPTQTAFVVSGPVAYVCDPAIGTIRRYTGYTLAGNIDERDSHGELLAHDAVSSLIARNVSDCFIDRDPAGSSETELVNLRLTLTLDGESFPVYHQTALEQLQP